MRSFTLGAGAALAGYLVARPYLFRLGATDEEVAAELPGDERVPDAQIHGTRAITVDAPPEAVWPWLAQIGYRRAGWYAFDFADNSGIPSAREIIPELQQPEVGQVIGEEGYRIVEFEPPRHLLLEFDHPRVEWIRKEGLWPRFGHSTWAFVLRPLDEGRRTRLITRMHYRLPFGIHLLYWPLFEVVDLVLQPTMLRAIRARAEGRVRPSATDVSSLR
jgi:hypothetical protein